MKKGVKIIKTNRGGLKNTNDVIENLKTDRIGFIGIDVYKKEEDLFFEDLSTSIILDDQFQRLVIFPNVLVKTYQSFLQKKQCNK